MTNIGPLLREAHKANDLGLAFGKTRMLGFVPRSFSKTLENAIHDMDEAKADLDGFYGDGFLIEDKIDDGSLPLDEETSETIADIHDEILAAADRIFLFYAFLLKNHGSLRQGLAPITKTIQEELDLFAPQFGEINNILSDWDALEEYIFDMLDDLRDKFLPSIKAKRRETGWHDDFAQTFLDGAELPRDRLLDRIEHKFFEHYGIPLGVFDVSDDVKNYLDAHTQHEGYTIHLVKEIKDGKMRHSFPGLTIVSLREHGKRMRTKDVVIVNAENVSGMISTPRPIFRPRNGF